MKKRNILVVLLSLYMVGCSASGGGNYYQPNVYGNSEFEEYTEINERGYIDPNDNPLSSFSLDSSTYAYSNLRRLINNNEYIDKNAVNIEQMLNYFDYSYTNDTLEALSSNLELFECPWNEEHDLALISVNAKEIEISDTKNNFVFLIDTSGSMNSENKLPLFQESFRLLSDSIGEDDVISIVTYATGVRVIADGIKGSEKLNLVAAVDELMAGGSTNGSGGIQKAYELAEKHLIDGGNNRVFIATDGDFNVGISSQGLLNEFISSKRKKDINLSVFGYGMGNTKHNTMETLATNGDGNAYYIDSLLEARKVFVDELGSTLNTVAKDSKIQVEFNPNTVKKYRLLGYENRMLTENQFEDSNTDAGEIGAGHTTIAMYEIELKDNPNNEFIYKTKLRYKDSIDNLDKEIISILSSISEVNDELLFASAVVEFGLILRDSEYKGNSSYEHLLNLLSTLTIYDDPYKDDFKNLVNKAYNNSLLNE